MVDNRHNDMSRPQVNCDKWKIYFLFQLCNQYAESLWPSSFYSFPLPPVCKI